MKIEVTNLPNKTEKPRWTKHLMRAGILDPSIVEDLKNILSSNKEDFIITGSVALTAHGFNFKKPAADLDIILINPSEKALSFLRDPSVVTHRDYPGMEAYTFNWRKVKVDVVIHPQIEHPFMEIDGLIFSGLMHIVGAKKSYGRPKDAIQLSSMARQIFSDTDLTKTISEA